ncbi:MAG: DUF3943 domain-containing protein [Kofleriaceae bacterium]
MTCGSHGPAGARRSLACAAALVVLAIGPRAGADPLPALRGVDPADAAPSSLDPEQPLRRSHLWATVHAVGVNAGFSVVGLAIGKEYLRISPSSIRDNITSSWVWDEDAFTTNQFGHPYLGALMFNAARSNGVGFWGAAIYTFLGSMFWELVMETETPSINDQIFTPTGGILLGEALHRFGRSLRWSDGRAFRIGREILAVAVDPMGALSRWTHGEAWRLTPPPPRFGFVSAGWNGLSLDFDEPSGERFQQTLGRAHAALAISYGLPTDETVVPRDPLDYFDFMIEGDVSRDSAALALHTRGLLWGRAFGYRGVRAIGGLMASYDFVNPERIRIGAFGLGAGAVVHAPIGTKTFAQITAMATAIPFGAAGGGVDEDGAGMETDRDYHRGPGSAQLLDIRLGRRGLGMINLTSRAFYIAGTYFDEGSEWVNSTRIGVLASVYDNHAIGVEGLFSVRRADFDGYTRDLVDSSAQLRLSYAFLSDLDFGGGR